MRLANWLSFSAAFLILVPAQSNAQHDGFPVELEQLLSDQIPLGTVAIGSSVPGFSDDIGTAFSFLDIDNGATVNYVLCYPLAESSITGELESGSETAMSGVVFVFCPGTIDLNDFSQFLIFFQAVQPDITSQFLVESQTVDLQLLTQQSVMENYADYCFFDSKGFDCSAPACIDALNNLDSKTRPILCLAGCCGHGANFRLPGVQYEMKGTNTAEFTFATDFDFEDVNFREFFQHYSFFTGNPDLDEPFFRFQRFEIPLYQPGDTNQDGNVDLLDVSGFLDCLNDGVYVFQCDINSDQSVNLLDVAPFVELLSN